MTARKSFQATCPDETAFAAARPCYRHTAWLAHCEDCTAWHLAALHRSR